MKKSVLICLANGSEEIEAVTTIDLLVRAGLQVSIASVNDDNELIITCSHGVRLLADAPLSVLANKSFEALVLPGGIRGVEYFQRSPLLIEYVLHTHLNGKLVAAICAAPALFLQHHKLFVKANMTCFPGLKTHIPATQWINERVVYDANYRLITSQGPGTVIDFALKIIELICGQQQVENIVTQLVL